MRCSRGCSLLKPFECRPRMVARSKRNPSTPSAFFQCDRLSRTRSWTHGSSAFSVLPQPARKCPKPSPVRERTTICARLLRMKHRQTVQICRERSRARQLCFTGLRTEVWQTPKTYTSRTMTPAPPPLQAPWQARRVRQARPQLHGSAHSIVTRRCRTPR